MRSLLVGVAVVCLSAPAIAHAGHKPAAILIPPIEAEYGAGTPVGEASSIANSHELRIGVHWASLAWKPTRFDIGIGYTGTFRTVPTAGHTYVLRDGMATLDTEDSVSLNGLYFSLAYAIENHRHWRTWIGGRVDSFTGDYQGRSLNVIGGAVRIGAEIFTAGAHGAGDRNALAFMAGAWALGVYVEGTVRTLPDELGPVGVGAGVSMRVPFILAVAN